ncbi:MAG: flagellar hook-basal body complex protein [Erythrobacter sp.]|jgi:flagellar hook protein FlgE|nr:flagellar hook-basal body complex protein [Erythrobacter sp.]
MSFFTALSGMRNAETDLRVISQNIANAETVGFKKSKASFGDLVANGGSTDPRLTPGIGSAVLAITQDFSVGQIQQTGRGLDQAINGDGYFATFNPVSQTTSFTRNGSFRAVAPADTGPLELQDAVGGLVLGFAAAADGSITPPAAFPPIPASDARILIPRTLDPADPASPQLASLSIDDRGTIFATYANGETRTIARIALASFPSNDGLRPVGQTKWEASGESGNPSYGEPGVGNLGFLFAGALERSNVDLATEMVSLLTAQRNFQANARAIDTATAISQTVLNLQR